MDCICLVPKIIYLKNTSASAYVRANTTQILIIIIISLEAFYFVFFLSVLQ